MSSLPEGRVSRVPEATAGAGASASEFRPTATLEIPRIATSAPLPRPHTGLPSPSVRSAPERRELLRAVYEEARECVRCPLHQTRTTVVFGAGNADADLMFVGEAPGANEDRMGLPFVGQAGKLLDKLLAEISLNRKEVFICNTLKCRPPDNRDPHPNEIEACQDYLSRQVDLIEPTVICTLGNFSTKLLRADSTGISRLHGREEVRIIGPRAVRLYPLYHPAAALYTPSTLEALRADFHRIPDLLALGPPEQPESYEPVPEVDDATDEQEETPVGVGAREPAAQLGLF
jgi:uracil-DNA glycosylase family 4